LVASRQFPHHLRQDKDLVAGKSVDYRRERREFHCAAPAVDHAPQLTTVAAVLQN